MTPRRAVAPAPRAVRRRTGGPRLLAVARRRVGGAEHGDDGQIMILTIAYALVALSLVLVVAAASSVHLERKQLFALADAAALDAADAIDLDAFYGGGAAGGLDRSVPLTERSVRAAVAAHVAASPAAPGFVRLGIGEPTGTPDGRTAEVTLTAMSRPAVVPWALVGWTQGIPIRVTSSARAQ